jgi:cell wall-associated NlpC family hydrolase
MTTRADVVAAAREWIATPWAHQQRVKGIAVDCAGLVVGVARELGLVEPDFDVNGYTRATDGTLLERCAQIMRPISRTEMLPGDVLVVATDTEPCHMGILGDYRHGGLSLIHAAQRGMNRVVEHRLLFLSNLRFKAAFALPGLN